jgi:flagellar hook-associated protein 1 FlgK
MAKIGSMMDVGKRSMMNSQTALQTVGHNIANKSTEGYSRQRVDIQSNVPITEGKYQIGMGARTANVSRINNPFIERQIGQEQAELGYLGGQSDGLMKVESVYNEQLNKGLNSYVTEFFNSFRELSNNPESMATRTLVKETAAHVTKDFQRMNKQLGDVRKDIDQQIATHVNEINGYVSEIAKLNTSIVQQEQGGKNIETANDQRDRRDLLIKKLGEKVNIKWAEGADGTVTISAGNSAILVAGDDYKQLEVKSTPAHGDKAEGCLDIIYKSNKDATPMTVTEQFTGGAVGGLLQVRDETIGALLNDMDEMAFNLATNVNDLHSKGYDGFNRTGQAFFAELDQMEGASSHLAIAQEILDDPTRIAAAAAPNSPADNTVANYIGNLQFQKMMRGGVATIDDFYGGVVGQVGVLTQRAASAQEAQTNVVKQLSNLRESISGVSLDEETTKMIEYQKAFDASARLIRTADEMFDTILNLKRL